MLGGKRISFIGAGNIAEALVKGLVASGRVARQDLVLSARRPERAEQVAGRYGARAATDNESCVRGASIVGIAVKPHFLAQVVSATAGAISPEAQGISLAPDVPTRTLERLHKPPATR